MNAVLVDKPTNCHFDTGDINLLVKEIQLTLIWLSKLLFAIGNGSLYCQNIGAATIEQKFSPPHCHKAAKMYYIQWQRILTWKVAPNIFKFLNKWKLVP